jgi:hypothetical protein
VQHVESPIVPLHAGEHAILSVMQPQQTMPDVSVTPELIYLPEAQDVAA